MNTGPLWVPLSSFQLALHILKTGHLTHGIKLSLTASLKRASRNMEFWLHHTGFISAPEDAVYSSFNLLLGVFPRQTHPGCNFWWVSWCVFPIYWSNFLGIPDKKKSFVQQRKLKVVKNLFIKTFYVVWRVVWHMYFPNHQCNFLAQNNKTISRNTTTCWQYDTVWQSVCIHICIYYIYIHTYNEQIPHNDVLSHFYW